MDGGFLNVVREGEPLRGGGGALGDDGLVDGFGADAAVFPIAGVYVVVYLEACVNGCVGWGPRKEEMGLA